MKILTINPVFWLLLCVPFFSNTAQADAQFKTKKYDKQRTYLTDVLSADFNGDGTKDLFVTSVSGPHEVYIGDENGGFSNLKHFVDNVRGTSSAFADFDGDGDMDVFVTPDQLMINDGSGRFEYQRIFATFDGAIDDASSVVAIDVENDGDMDIIRTDLFNRVFLHINDGQAIFEQRMLDLEMSSVAAGDYDGDGYVDLWSITGALSVYLNDKTGGFANDNKVTGEVSEKVPSLIVADIDNDGDLDAQGFTRGSDSFEGKKDYFLPRYINNSDGTFTLKNLEVFRDFGQSSAKGLLINMDTDEDLELWTAGDFLNISTLYDSKKDGSIDLDNAVFLDEIHHLAAAAVDIDKDGLLDVVSVGFSGQINVWRNTGTFDFTLRENTATINRSVGSFNKAALADINVDGHMDFLIANSADVFFHKNDGRGNFNVSKLTSADRYSNIVTADFNADGYSDFAVTRTFRSPQIWINKKDETFEINTQPILQDLISTGLDSADYDADGDVDLLLIEGGELLLLKNNGSGNFTLAQRLENFSISAQFADIDRDGRAEIVTSEAPLGVPRFSIYTLQGNNYGLVESFFVETEIFYTPQNYSIVDIDNDGDMDILPDLFIEPDNLKQRLVYLQQSPFEFVSDTISLPEISVSAVADINQDGLNDLYGTDNDGTAIAISKGNGQYEKTQKKDLIEGGQALFVDLDGDADVDIISTFIDSIRTMVNTATDNDYSGFWYNPNQSGHGLQIEKIYVGGVEQLFVSWYVYKDGAPIWLNGIGQLQDNQAEVNMRITSGGQFVPDFNTDEVMIRSWGTLTLEFSDINSVNLSWDGTEAGFTAGNLSMQRLTEVAETDKDLSGIRNCHSGSWYNPEQSGHGLLMQIIGEVGAERMIMTWYTYLDGQQYWILAQGNIFGKLARLQAKAFEGTDFPPLFNASEVSSEDWGEITFTLKDDNRAKLSWESKLPEFSSGTLELSKLTSIDRYRCD